MNAHPVYTRRVNGFSPVRSSFATGISVPDNRVQIDDPPGTDRFLSILFLRWNPAGRNRPGRVSDDEVTEWVDGLIMGEDEAFERREAFYYQTWPLGWRLIGLLNRFGVKAQLLPDDVYESRHGRTTSGKYLVRRKLIVVKDSALFNEQRSTVLHEFGHAIDNLISSLCNGGNEISVKLLHWFAPQRAGLVSDYAGKDPGEYLAESVEAYFMRHRQGILRRADPKMFNFLHDLFTISAG